MFPERHSDSVEFLVEGETAKIDEADGPLIEGRKLRLRVAASNCRIMGVQVSGRYLHQLILPVDPPLSVDHINRDPLDNQRQNLRPATRTQQLQNRCGWASSGYKGVIYKPDRPGKEKARWETWITIEGKKTYLGRSVDLEVAARLYDKAALQYFGEFAVLNFPAV